MRLGLKKKGLLAYKKNGLPPKSGLIRKSGKKRRKKGEITKLKEALWLLCRQITKQRYGNECFTCKRQVPDGKGMHTGHFLTSSLCSIDLRYDLKNLRPQCYHCNINLSGNWPAYQERMERENPGITARLITLNNATKGQMYPPKYFQDKITEYTTLLDS